MGILANAAWLESHGYTVSGVHIPLSLHYGFTADDTLNMIVGSDPLLVAIGLNWVHFSDGAIQTAQRIKAKRPACPIIIGGQHAGLFAQEIATQNAHCIDGVILGEAEVPLMLICQSLRETGKLPEKLPGLVRGAEDITPAEVVEPMDGLPVYRYSTLRPHPLQANVGAISTTRGACPFNCSWCIEPVIGRLQGRRKLQFHSADRITDQIDSLMQYGISRFTIQDNFFVGGDKKLVDLANALIKRRLRPAHINIFAHPESYTLQGLEAFSGCCDKASVDYGVETGSRRVATLNNRRLNPDEVVERIANAVSALVEPFTWWMVGLPGEDDQALEETEDLILRTMCVGGIPRWVSPLILLPETPIYRDPARFGVRLRFEGFSEYATFSRATLAEAVMFSHTMTHETREATCDGISAASRRLRKFITDNLHVAESFYASQRLQPDLASVRGRVQQSFF
ncbi:MAG: B12-binding domain-containing radical SAM protein [Bauldia sp.]|nr:B12-binding domain-containing radical SAM protein [Bauldia sp.]